MKIENFGNKIKNFFRINFYREENIIDYIEAKEILEEDSRAVLLDVRSKQEYDEYHLNGAICVPNYELQNKIGKIIEDKNQVIVIYCQTGGRSGKAAKMLRKMGYKNVYEISGGIDNI